MEVRGKHRKETRVPPEYSLDTHPLEPIKSERRLQGGYAAGDRIYHLFCGAGIILSIAPEQTIFQFSTGLVTIPTIFAHVLLTPERGVELDQAQDQH